MNSPIELYDVEVDIGETTDVAGGSPEVVERIAEIMESGRTPSELFPLVRGE